MQINICFVPCSKRTSLCKAGIFKLNFFIMKKAKLAPGMEDYSDAAFENKTQGIYASMLNNLYFPNPTPAITELDVAVKAYSDVLLAAQSRGKNEVALKNQARETLATMVIQLANSAMTTANGDRAKLVSTGIPMAKDGESSLLTKPENMRLTDGVNVGELVTKVAVVKGAMGYAHQYTLDPLTSASEWNQVLATTSKCTLKNLVAEKKYWCRVLAFGANGQVVYSDAICRVVQ